jgi:hypothetical protein
LPLTQLTKKNQAFVWTAEVDKAFTQFKEAFTSTPVLAHVHLAWPFTIEADASDFALGSILVSQPGEDGELYLVAFHSRKFNAKNINYEVHDKELQAVVDSFAQWQLLLEDPPYQIIVYSNHKILKYFQTAQVLKRQQAR